MKQTLRPNAELDLLTQEELRSVVTEVISGYLRPPRSLRVPDGVDLDANGDGTVTCYTCEAGMRFTVTRMEFSADGYNGRETPWNPATLGGVDLYVDGQWRDGIQWGNTSVATVGHLPAVYTESKDRAIVMEDGAVLTAIVENGPASVGFLVATCGWLEPLQPVV